MIRHTLAIALTLALTACGAPTEAPQVAAPAPMETPVAPPMETVAKSAEESINDAVAGSWRTPEFVARDSWRHPAETLSFFGVTPSSKVIEVTPGGGWYSEILAPLLKDNGRYIAAIIDEAAIEDQGAKDYHSKANQSLRDKFAAAPDQFGAAEFVAFANAAPNLGDADSADLVLTFRNVHNWMGGAAGPQVMFDGFFKVLKPGGALGVVEHRANADVPAGDRSGYVSEAQVIAMAQAAGFVLEEKSEINANANDTKDHPNGVWTLPPGSRTPDGEDAAKYQAIGESDRMTLRFRKPAA